MGIKLHPSMNVIPAELRDGMVMYSIGTHNYEIAVPAAKRFTFKKQYRQFMGDNIMAVLCDDEYIFVMRFDGTGCVAKRHGDKVFLVISFVFEYKLMDLKSISSGGVMYYSGTKEFIMVSRYDFEDDYAVLCCQNAATILMALKDNPEYVRCNSVSEILPVLSIENDGVFITDKNQNRIVKIECELYKSNGYAMLGGVTV